MSIINKEKILEQAKDFIDEGKYDKAIREYEKILLADPGDLRVKLRVAELYTKRKQINDAIRLYREVADAYVEEGFFLKAVTVNKNILRLNPSMTAINEQLAGLYERMGLLADAIRQYGIVASALQAKGQRDRVLEIRERIVQLKPDDGVARVRLAETYQREGRMDEAVNQYEEYAKQLEAGGKDNVRLAEIYEKILVHRPGNHDMLRKLIDIHIEAEDRKKALKWLELGKGFVDKDPHLLKLQAGIYALQNQNETARTKYLMLADICREAGDVDDALGAYFEILVLLPDEEDRLVDIVEELRSGAMSGLVDRARKRREAIEAEQEAGEDGNEDGKRREKPETKKKDPQKPPEPKKPVEEKTSSPSGAARPDPAKFKEADAAFDLGKVYRDMGLDEESGSEFEKARSIYESFVGTDLDDDSLKKHLAAIDSEIGRTAPRKTPEPKPKKEEKKEKPVAETKKKKISFV